MESPNSKGSSYLIVGLFFLIGIIVATGFIVFMGGTGLFSSELRLTALFRDARGLNVGAPVYMSGVDVGRVLGKSLPLGDEKGVVVSFSVDGKNAMRVTSNASVTISSAGMLGDKTLVLNVANGGELVKDHDRIMVEEEKDIGSYLSSGGEVLENIKEITKNFALLMKDARYAKKVDRILDNVEAATANLKKQTEGNWGAKLDRTLTHLDSVMGKIDSGQGTLGALVNDPSLHEDLRVVVGGAKRSKLIRFLVKQTIKNKEDKTASELSSPKAQE